jgi:hypothetical protein
MANTSNCAWTACFPWTWQRHQKRAVSDSRQLSAARLSRQFRLPAAARDPTRPGNPVRAPLAHVYGLPGEDPRFGEKTRDHGPLELPRSLTFPRSSGDRRTTRLPGTTARTGITRQARTARTAPDPDGPGPAPAAGPGQLCLQGLAVSYRHGALRHVAPWRRASIMTKRMKGNNRSFGGRGIPAGAWRVRVPDEVGHGRGGLH